MKYGDYDDGNHGNLNYYTSIHTCIYIYKYIHICIYINILHFYIYIHDIVYIYIYDIDRDYGVIDGNYGDLLPSMDILKWGCNR